MNDKLPPSDPPDRKPQPGSDQITDTIPELNLQDPQESRSYNPPTSVFEPAAERAPIEFLDSAAADPCKPLVPAKLSRPFDYGEGNQ